MKGVGADFQGAKPSPLVVFQTPSCQLNRESPLVTMETEYNPPRARWSVSVVPNESSSFMCIFFVTM